MHFLFLNQYGPPDPVPTARLLGELAETLRAAGHSVEILSQSQSYQGRPARGGRLRRELQASWAIMLAGWKLRSDKLDVVLALSSPPGLLVVGALLAWRHRARLAHWAMDLYPELALALGEIRPGGFAAHLVGTAIQRAYRRPALVVALDEDMRVHLQPLCRCQVRVVEPWPSTAALAAANNFSEAGERNTPWTWLYSGNLGRAHEWQTLLDAQRLLEDRALPIRLVFQGDGAARAAARDYADRLGLRACEWTGYVSEGELVSALLGARLLIVTQRPETRGLLWPSKLALLERLPRPILYVGPENGAIAQRLQARGNAGVFAPGQTVMAADWIEDLYRHPLSDAPMVKANPPTLQEAGPVLLKRWLEELSP